MPGPSSGYLPPVVATLVGDAADAIRKVAELKAALQDLSKTPTTFTVNADTAAALADLARARGQANAIGEPPITFTVAINSAEALAELAAIRAIAGSAAIEIPVDANVAPLLASIATAKSVASSVGPLGVMGALLWGKGGRFGFAQFGSVMSLAGFGFEHVATTALGLAGSLSGALLGSITLVSGALATMAVGELTDLAGIGQAAGDIKQYGTLVTNLNQAIAVYGKNSTEAALAQYQMNQWMKDLAPSTVAAIKAAYNTSAAFHALFDHSTSAAETAGAQIINQAMLIGEKFLPTIGKFAASNLGVIKTDLQPLFGWLGTTGLGLFTQIEQKFSSDLPAAMGAFDNGVELLVKFLAYASSKSGGFIDSLDKFFTKWNSASMTSDWETHVDNMIGLFHTWWSLLKDVGHTIFDVFHNSVGLGTNIVTTIDGMLQSLDKWIQSSSGTSSLHTIFQAHLQEIDNLLKLLPQLLSSFSGVYLLIAPDLTDIVSGLAGVVGWILKIPTAGPLIAWGLAVAFFASKMKLWAIGSWIIDLGKLAVAFAGLASSEGLAAGIKGLPGLANKAFNAGSSAIGQRVFVTNWEMIAGGGGGAGGAAGSAGFLRGTLIPSVMEAIGGTAGLALVAGLVATGAVASAVILAFGNSHAFNSPSNILSSPGAQQGATGGAAIWADLTQGDQGPLRGGKAGAASMAIKALAIQQNIIDALTSQGVSQGNATKDAAIIAKAWETGKVKTPAQLDALIKSLTATDTSAAGVAAASGRMSQIIGSSMTNSVGTAIILLQGDLQKMGLSFGKSVQATDALSAFIVKNGPLTAAQYGIWLNDVKHGVTDAFDINLSMDTAKTLAAQIPLSFANIKTALNNLHKSIPGTIGLTGGGKGLLGFGTGGLADYPETGGLAMLHGQEAVVPKAKAGWLWPLMMAAISSGKPPAFESAGVPGGGAAPLGMPAMGSTIERAGGVSSAGSLAMTNHVTIQVTGPGTNDQTAKVVEAAVYKAMNKVGRQMAAGARTYGFMPS